jgi:hypothetical protein
MGHDKQPDTYITPNQLSCLDFRLQLARYLVMSIYLSHTIFSHLESMLTSSYLAKRYSRREKRRGQACRPHCLQGYLRADADGSTFPFVCQKDEILTRRTDTSQLPLSPTTFPLSSCKSCEDSLSSIHDFSHFFSSGHTVPAI